MRNKWDSNLQFHWTTPLQKITFTNVSYVLANFKNFDKLQKISYCPVMYSFSLACLWIFLAFASQPLYGISLEEQFKQKGYVEICNKRHGAATFDALYTYFDELIEFLQADPIWAQKLYSAKERFIRSSNRNYYSSDFFGFYDESKRAERRQISFYYSIHFHEFMYSHYPEFTQVLQITKFFDGCLEIHKTYGDVFSQAALELGLEAIFSWKYAGPPILVKVVKYLASYTAAKPHYDGTLFSLFLDSTDNQSLLLSPYKSIFTVDDFSSPLREFNRESDQSSLLLIPGALLTEFSIYPTPHIVIQSSKVRYATIAFAMRSHHTPQKIEVSPLPSLNIE